MVTIAVGVDLTRTKASKTRHLDEPSSTVNKYKKQRYHLRISRQCRDTGDPLLSLAMLIGFRKHALSGPTDRPSCIFLFHHTSIEDGHVSVHFTLALMLQSLPSALLLQPESKNSYTGQVLVRYLLPPPFFPEQT